MEKLKRKLERFYFDCSDFRNLSRKVSSYRGVPYGDCINPLGKKCKIILAEKNQGHLQVRREFIERCLKENYGLIIIVDSAANKYRSYDLRELHIHKQLIWSKRYCDIPNKAFNTISEIRRRAEAMKAKKIDEVQTKLEL